MHDFDSLWDYDHPAETETKFRELLSETPQDKTYHAELLTQIARTQGLQRHFDDAHRTLDQVETMLPDVGFVAKIRYLLERGRVFNSSGKRDAASPLFHEAWETAREAKEGLYAVDAAHMIAIVAPADKQLAWNLTAIEYAEQSEDKRARGWLGSLYNNTGWSYHDMGDYETALDLFERGLQLRQQHDNTRATQIAKWTVARALRSLNRIDDALAMQQALGKELEEAGISDGYVVEEIAECLLALGRADEAKPFFAQAYAELSSDPWLAENEAEHLQRLQQLGS